MEVLTVGHSTHTIERFIELLGQGGVTLVADVRRYPGSRRNPQFGAQQLATALSEADIHYQSFAGSLGGRRSSSPRAGVVLPPGLDNSAWRSPSFRAYADHMTTAAFADGLRRLEELARLHRVAIMCAEAHPSRCHRQLIADTLDARGWRVLHLLSGGSVEVHRLSKHGVVQDGRVYYPGTPELELGQGT